MENTTASKASVNPPRTPDEALQAIDAVRVPAVTFVEWLTAVGTLPAGHVADLYVSMRRHLNEAIQEAATLHAER